MVFLTNRCSSMKCSIRYVYWPTKGALKILGAPCNHSLPFFLSGVAVLAGGGNCKTLLVCSGLFNISREVACRKLPVHQFPIRVKIVLSEVAVVDVIRMFPHIACQQWHGIGG